MTRKQLIILVAIIAGIGVIIGGIFLIRYFQARSLDTLDAPQQAQTQNGERPTPDAEQPTDGEIQAELDMLAERPTDTDGDGLTDEQEAEHGTNPEYGDTDNDGYSDYEEVMLLNQDPLSEDDPYARRQSVEESRADRIERTGPAPSDAEEDATDTTDTDGDGLTDQEETGFGTNANNPDSDGDGLSDGEEIVVYRTDPNNADSDGDGFNDGEEVNSGYNPRGSGECANANCTP